MARNVECHNCGHVQLVGIIENGRSGYPNPKARCRRCLRRGGFRWPAPLKDDDPVLLAARRALSSKGDPNE